MMNMGTHILAELYGIEASVLKDETGLMRIFRYALDQEGFPILNQLSHRFTEGGQGVTGMFLLSVSHATFHTFPEHAYMAVDIFSCGTADPHAVLRLLIERLKPERVDTKQLDRGEKRELERKGKEE